MPCEHFTESWQRAQAALLYRVGLCHRVHVLATTLCHTTKHHDYSFVTNSLERELVNERTLN